jgi:hypothetical protein
VTPPSSPTRGLDSAIHSWELFVHECELGYQHSIYDFDNDLSIRDVLETSLRGPEQCSVDEIGRIRSRVRIADEKFRRLALEGSVRRSDQQAWWHIVIPKHAGPELAADLRSEYGVSVKVVTGRDKLP